MSKKKPQEESLLCGNDEGLTTVCQWLKVNVDDYKAKEKDYEIDMSQRPNRGGVGSENLTKKAVKAQTSGQVALGGLERKLMPKAVQRVEAQKRKAEESDDDDGIVKGAAPSASTDLRSELEQHAAKQKSKQRKRKKSKQGGKSPAAQPQTAPKQPVVAVGADD